LFMPFLSRLIVAFVLVFGAAGCATPPPSGDKEAWAEYRDTNDPMEPTNRAIFEVNRGLDRALLKPVATAYRDFLPAWLRSGFGNLLDHLRSPIVLLNDILQGEVDRALVTMTRFVINTGLGFGFMDMASAMGMEGHDEDFGQTLAVWGMPSGPFVMLPLFGPSNPRDAVGRLVDFMADPFNIWAANTDREHLSFARTGAHAVHVRSGNIDLIDDMEKTSLDFYAAIRSLYRQRRADVISNGRGSANLPAPGMSEAPNMPLFDAAMELSRR
jgi:phospholipid-binding lipoprotein MlaA